MLEARAERGDVGGGERSLEGVQDDAVRAVADGVDVLEVKSACCPIFFERRPG